MSFFHQSAKPLEELVGEPVEDTVGSKEKVDPSTVTIDGDLSKLIKVVEDNPDIQEGKVDAIGPFGFIPVNYDPETGEMK